MLISIFLILLLVGLVSIQRMRGKHTSKELYKMPSPPYLPFFGNALFMYGSFETMWKTWRKFANRFYPTVCFWIFSKPLIFIRHPDDVEKLLKSKSNIDKSEFFYSNLTKVELDGIIASGGKKWLERRRMMDSALNRNTKGLDKILEKHTELFIRQTQNWNDESIQNVIPLILNLSINVICESTMGFDMHKTNTAFHRKYEETLQEIFVSATHRTSKPYLTDWMIKCVPLGWKLSKCLSTLKDFTFKFIENRQKCHESESNILSGDFSSNSEVNPNSRDAKAKSSKDLLFIDLLLLHKANGLIDDKGIHEETTIMMAAGYETTAMSLSLLLLLLAENEKAQNLARKEVVDIMKEKGNTSILTISDLRSLQYLDRCIKEALRMYSIAPHIGRRLAEDTQFDKYLIPRKTDVIVNIFDIHRDPNFWAEPDKFNPDRFLPEFSADRHPYAYIPFSKGLRACIGKQFATLEMKFVTAHILYNFLLKPIDFSNNLTFCSGIMLKLSKPQLRVKFIKIKQHS